MFKDLQIPVRCSLPQICKHLKMFVQSWCIFKCLDICGNVKSFLESNVHSRVQRLRNFNTHWSKRHRNLLGLRARNTVMNQCGIAINIRYGIASLSTSRRLAITSYRVVIAMTRGNLNIENESIEALESRALETPSFATRLASKQSRHLFLSVWFPGKQERSR